MSPFRIFIASPVNGLEDYRREVANVARDTENNGDFEFCFFEKDPHNPPQMLPAHSITESIFSHFGGEFDAFFLFFRDSVGTGTRAEFEHYRGVLKVTNPDCQLWWRQIDCDAHGPSATELLTELHKPGGNTGLQRRDLGAVDNPDRLANLFVSQLMYILSEIRNGNVKPFADL